MKNECLKLLYEVLARLIIRIGMNDFFGKILLSDVRIKRDQNGPKMRFYKFHEQLTFSENLHKVRVAYRMKIDSSNSNNFLLVLRF